MKVCVVIAAYDERENVGPLARRLHAALSSIPRCRADILFVVEGTDGTREVLEGLAEEVSRLRVLYSEKPSGLGAAFRRGFEEVPRDADWVVTMDADLNHQPEELPRLLEEAAARKADVLIGSRFVRGGRVEGIPLWKRALSGTMNVVMRHLFGLPVLDKTSGYRVYRASALRGLRFANDDFAFLPELLIDARRQGLRLAEAPIHFRNRPHGVSKMDIAKTIRSYLSLLRSRFDRWSLAAALVLLAGIAIRLAATFPLHKWGADGDSLLTGLTAFRVLEGKLPVFYSGVRIGALESYLHAVVFALLGASRAATAVVPLLTNAAILVAFLLLARALAGRKEAVVATLIVAAPSASFLFWTYQPNGYPLTVLFCLLTLLFADRLARREGGIPTAAALGLSAGLGWWNSIQTAAVLAPTALWLLAHRPRLLREPRILAAGAFAFLVGAGPWIAFNLFDPQGTFRGNFAARPASGASQVVSNAAYFVRYSVPELLVSTDPEDGMNPPNVLLRALRLPAAAVWVLVGATLAALALRCPRTKEEREGGKPWLLLVFVAFVMGALNVLSEAGQTRGLTVRYLLPAYFLFPVALALALRRISAVARPVAWAVGSIVLAFNLAGIYWPGTPFRQRMERDDRSERKVLETLRTHGVEAVFGNYWYVYPINFLSHERVRGIPYQPWTDYYAYAERLAAPGRWALFSRVPGELEAWAAMANVTGEHRALGNSHFVFFPSPNPPDAIPLAETCDRLRRARQALGEIR